MSKLPSALLANFFIKATTGAEISPAQLAALTETAMPDLELNTFTFLEFSPKEKAFFTVPSGNEIDFALEPSGEYNLGYIVLERATYIDDSCLQINGSYFAPYNNEKGHWLLRPDATGLRIITQKNRTVTFQELCLELSKENKKIYILEVTTTALAEEFI